MRILSDFDGVFTTQEREADAVGARQIELLGEALGDPALATTLLTELRAEARKRPEDFGWISADEISCYADEDPYAFHNAVGSALYAHASPDALEKLTAAGMPTHDLFEARAFDEGTTRFRAANPSHVLPEALAALAELLSAGIEVVLVSNSSTARIEGMLKDAGLSRFGQAKPRVRGGAQKFRLAEDPKELAESARFGPREIRLRRPSYFSILREEAPDLLIGDVLSLDLAMPHAARAIVPALDEMILVLKKHPYTPQWSLDACKERGIEVVEAFGKVKRLLGV